MIGFDAILEKIGGSGKYQYRQVSELIYNYDRSKTVRLTNCLRGGQGNTRTGSGIYCIH